jgi:putative PEP-CTERM system histidine kinase
MAPPQLALALAGLATLMLAVIALARPPRGRLRWSFAAGMALLAVEAFAGLVLTGYTDTAEDRLLWLRIEQAAGIGLLLPWVVFTIALATPHWRPLPRRGTRALIASGVVAVALAAAGWHPAAFEVSDLPGAFYAMRLGTLGTLQTTLELVGTVAVLAGLEAALRASRGEARWRTKYLVLGLGGIFLVRFYFLSQAALFNVVFGSYLTTSGATLVVGSLLIAVSLTRDRLGIDFSVSRQVVYRSVAVGVLGVYLIAVGGLGWLLNHVGMPEEVAWGSVIVFVTALGLAAIMLSEAVRWRIKRFVAVHFYRSKYDYREQWTAFTRRLGSLVTVDEVATELVQAVADAVGTKTVILFLRDATDGRYHPTAARGIRVPVIALEPDGALVMRARDAREPVLLDEGCPPAWLGPAITDAVGDSAVLLPLRWRDEFVGVMLMGAERTGTPYTGEDVEFLGTVAQQAAGALATAQLAETLTRAREFEAFHRLTSFVIHDLKNSISALSMLSDNALRHFDDPEFQRDAVKTVARTTDRMKALLARLTAAPETAGARREPVDVTALAKEATKHLVRHDRVELVHELGTVPPVAADAEALSRAIQNLVNNAVQSIQTQGVVTVRAYEARGRVVVEVADTGCGMSEDFVRRSLFSPFRTTKKGGWGIGLYQTKGLIEAHGGTIEVTSKEGAGSTFRVTLPATQGEAR